VIEVACLAHVRRKFFEARTSAPVPAHAALARIRLLYKSETAAEGLPAEGRRARRQRESVPLPSLFGEWLTEERRRALPKSPVGQAKRRRAFVTRLAGLPYNMDVRAPRRLLPG
jgi:transposase